jgi:uncharacterized protein YoxC
VTGISTHTQSIVLKYNQLYQKLYKREPRGLRIINNEFVIVNETKIRVSDLEQLNIRLEEEYTAQQKQKRNNIQRLIGWLRKS